MRAVKWFYPGLQVKRWFLVFWIGLIVFSLGVLLIISIKIPIAIEIKIANLIKKLIGRNIPYLWIDLSFIFLGLILMVLGIRQWFSSIYTAVIPYEKKKLVEVLYERGQLKHGFKIVTLGGGTGLSSLLRGLKHYTSNLTAIVTVSDDGGSSGKLRQILGILPPGDIRNCLTALASEESLMSELFQYRFPAGIGLQGHSFGNLFLAAMTGICGDFEKAVKQSGKILAVSGKVLPATLNTTMLCAKMSDGSITEGESAISRSSLSIEKVFLKPVDCQPLPESLQKIKEADAIILGPGSLYTSLICNLLIPGITEAIKQSKAIKIYVLNIMTQRGETDNFTASDHIKTITDHIQVQPFNYILINNKNPSKLLEKYAEEGAKPVEIDFEELKTIGIKPILADILSEDLHLRHHPKKLAESIIKTIVESQKAES